MNPTLGAFRHILRKILLVRANKPILYGVSAIVAAVSGLDVGLGSAAPHRSGSGQTFRARPEMRACACGTGSIDDC